MAALRRHCRPPYPSSGASSNSWRTLPSLRSRPRRHSAFANRATLGGRSHCDGNQHRLQFACKLPIAVAPLRVIRDESWPAQPYVKHALCQVSQQRSFHLINQRVSDLSLPMGTGSGCSDKEFRYLITQSGRRCGQHGWFMAAQFAKRTAATRPSAVWWRRLIGNNVTGSARGWATSTDMRRRSLPQVRQAEWASIVRLLKPADLSGFQRT